MRDSQGRLILNEYKKIDDYIIGRKKKIWLIKDDKKYLFKTGGTNYEIYAELICCELARQCGFPCAFYDLGILDGNTGVLTPSFLRRGDIILSGEQYLNNARVIALQNNLNMSFNENSIENILNAIAIQEGRLDDIAEVILLELLQLWCFDLAIMESDRNSTNWSLIRNIDGYISLAPIYDCSTMAMMNNDVYSLYLNLRSNCQIYNLIDSIQYALKIDNKGYDNIYQDFDFICESFPNELEEIVFCLEKIDVYTAIDNINKRINSEMSDGEFSIPNFIGFWLDKTIKTRIKTLRSIFENNKSKRLKKKF